MCTWCARRVYMCESNFRSSWCEMSNRRVKVSRIKIKATLGTPFNFNEIWHDLVLSGRKTRGRRVGEIFVEMLINSRKNAEIDENQDRCPRFKRNARKNGEMLMIHENTWNALRIEFTSVAKLRFQGKLVIDALKCVKPSKIGLKWTKMWNHGKWLIWIHVLSEYL